MQFYLGTHHPNWLGLVAIPWFLSDATLREYKKLPRAMAPWAADSGGFMELKMHGRWTQSAKDYAQRARRYKNEIGHLQWIAVQDWMCEPEILAKTGLTQEEHQERTIDSLIELRSLAPDVPWAPVLQGWTLCAHDLHAERYAQRGIHLDREPVVGVGSVCRRQKSAGITVRVRVLRKILGLRLHGFGVRKEGLNGSLADDLDSADSLAWSMHAIHNPGIPGHHLPGLGRPRGHKKCNNCLEFALEWRAELLEKLGLENDAKPLLYDDKGDVMRPAA